VRDALSLLDQVIAFAGRNIAAADVATVLGLSETTFFARLVTLIGEGEHAGILEALNEAAASGRDFKMLFRDLLNFVRNLLLVAGGANESMLSLSPEDLDVIRSSAEKFSYTELLRIANLLLRDDETVNKAEHQRLAVEIALLKAATFPRLRAVEEALSGTASAPQPQPRAAKTTKQAAPASNAAFVERIKKARAITGAYLEDAKLSLDGNVLRIALSDAFAAESVRNAQPLLDEIARELFGAGAKVEVTSDEKPPEPQTATLPLREDPVVKAFQKHLGGELVEPRKR
jgi:DNA polymerase III gamma/tau subunit